MKKYKLTKVKKEYGPVTFYQIEALKDFSKAEELKVQAKNL